MYSRSFKNTVPVQELGPWVPWGTDFVAVRNQKVWIKKPSLSLIGRLSVIAVSDW